MQKRFKKQAILWLAVLLFSVTLLLPCFFVRSAQAADSTLLSSLSDFRFETVQNGEGTTVRERAGTEEDPFILSSVQHFIRLEIELASMTVTDGYRGKFFKIVLPNDENGVARSILDLSESYMPDVNTEIFLGSIGTQANPFRGNLNGNGKTLWCSASLFAYATEANISFLGMEAHVRAAGNSEAYHIALVNEADSVSFTSVKLSHLEENGFLSLTKNMTVNGTVSVSAVTVANGVAFANKWPEAEPTTTSSAMPSSSAGGFVGVLTVNGTLNVSDSVSIFSGVALDYLGANRGILIGAANGSGNINLSRVYAINAQGAFGMDVGTVANALSVTAEDSFTIGGSSDCKLNSVTEQAPVSLALTRVAENGQFHLKATVAPEYAKDGFSVAVCKANEVEVAVAEGEISAAVPETILPTTRGLGGRYIARLSILAAGEESAKHVYDNVSFLPKITLAKETLSYDPTSRTFAPTPSVALSISLSFEILRGENYVPVSEVAFVRCDQSGVPYTSGVYRVSVTVRMGELFLKRFTVDYEIEQKTVILQPNAGLNKQYDGKAPFFGAVDKNWYSLQDQNGNTFTPYDPKFEALTGMFSFVPLYGEKFYVGSYEITQGTFDFAYVDPALEDAPSNYKLTFTNPSAKKFIIDRAQILVTPVAKQKKTFDGLAPESILYEVFLDGEPFDVTEHQNAFEGTLAIVHNLNDDNGKFGARTYSISQGTLALRSEEDVPVNFNLIFTENVLYTIEPMPIFIIPEAGQTKVYDSSAPAEILYRIMTAKEDGEEIDLAEHGNNRLVGAFMLADAEGNALSAYHAGTFRIVNGTGTAAFKVYATGRNAVNYKITCVEDVTFTITRAKITVTPNAGQGKVYDSEKPAELKYTVTEGKLFGKDVFSGALAISTANAGSHLITQGSLNVAPVDEDGNSVNYEITFDDSVPFVISPREVRLVLANNTTHTYSASAVSLPISVQLAGTGHGLSAAVSGQEIVVSKNGVALSRLPFVYEINRKSGGVSVREASILKAGEYTVSVSAEAWDNFALASFDAVTCTVSKREISIGDLSVVKLGAQFVLVPSSLVGLSEYAAADVVISEEEICLTKDGTTDILPYAFSYFEGTLTGDGSLSFSTVAETRATAGKYYLASLSCSALSAGWDNFTLSAGDAGNDTLSVRFYAGEETLSVEDVVVEYTGKEIVTPVLNAISHNLDGVSVSYEVYQNGQRVTPIAVGEYEIRLVVDGQDGTFTLPEPLPTAKLVIMPKTLTVTVLTDLSNVRYTGSEIKIDYSLSGAVNGERPEVELVFDGGVSAAVAIGDYSAHFALKDRASVPVNGNYRLAEKTFSFSVKKATLIEFGVEASTITYYTNILHDSVLTGQFFGNNGGEVEGILEFVNPMISLGAGRHNVQFRFTPTGTAADLYEVYLNSVVIEVLPYEILVVPEANQSRQYNGTNIASIQYSVFDMDGNPFNLAAAGGVMSGSLTFDTLEYRDGVIVSVPNKNVGSYNISIGSLTAGKNFKINLRKNIAFTITPKEVGVIFTGYTGIVYTGEPIKVSAAADNSILGEDAGVVLVYTQNNREVSPVNAGTYVARVIGLSNPNYTLKNEIYAQTFVIERRSVDGSSFVSKQVEYNGQPQGITFDESFPSYINVTYEGNGVVNIGKYTIKAKFENNPNYRITKYGSEVKELTATLTIEPKVIRTVNFGNTKFVYNGKEQYPTVSSPDVLAGDDALLRVDFEILPIKAGTHVMRVTAADSSNYTVKQGGFSVEFTIEKAPLAVVAAKTLQKWYDGTKEFSISLSDVKLEGLFGDDDVRLVGTPAIALESAQVGEDIAISVSGLTLNGVDVFNYDLIPTDSFETTQLKMRILPIELKGAGEFGNTLRMEIPKGTVVLPGSILSGKTVDVGTLSELDSQLKEELTQKIGAAFDIKLEKDGVTVNPDGTVVVTLVVPDAIRTEEIRLFRVEENGFITELATMRQGSEITFETEHFSIYLLTVPYESHAEDMEVLWGFAKIALLGFICVLAVAMAAAWIYSSVKNKKKN